MVLQPATTTNRKAVFWSRAQVANDRRSDERERCSLFSSSRSKSVALDYSRSQRHRDCPVDRRTNQWDHRTDWLPSPSPFPPTTTVPCVAPRDQRITRLIPVVCHIDGACRIDPHAVRIRQLRQLLPLTLSTGHDNPFFGALHPFHHTMIIPVRHVDSVISIDTDEARDH